MCVVCSTSSLDAHAMRSQSSSKITRRSRPIVSMSCIYLNCSICMRREVSACVGWVHIVRKTIIPIKTKHILISYSSSNVGTRSNDMRKRIREPHMHYSIQPSSRWPFVSFSWIFFCFVLLIFCFCLPIVDSCARRLSKTIEYIMLYLLSSIRRRSEREKSEWNVVTISSKKYLALSMGMRTEREISRITLYNVSVFQHGCVCALM